jgi:hypothetical protein
MYCGPDVRIFTESLAMIKTKKSTVHHVVEAKRWELSGEKSASPIHRSIPAQFK